MTVPTMPDALERSHATAWEVRKASVTALAAHLPEADAFDRLVAMIDDEDTSVGQQAAIALATRGDLAGLGAVAKAYATLEDDIGYFLSGALGSLWQDRGYPLPENLRALGSDPDPDVVRGAAELAEYLSAQ